MPGLSPEKFMAQVRAIAQAFDEINKVEPLTVAAILYAAGVVAATVSRESGAQNPRDFVAGPGVKWLMHGADALLESGEIEWN